MLAERWTNDSLVRGWRSGSVATLWQISVSRVAVMSRISLWRIVGMPPMWQIMAADHGMVHREGGATIA